MVCNSPPLDYTEGSMQRLNVSRFVQHHRNILFFRNAPTWLGFLYIRMVFKIYYFFKFRERSTIRKNIMSFLDAQGWRDSMRAERVVRQTFHGIFLHYYEKMFSAYKTYQEVHHYFENNVSVEGLEHLDAALQAGTGVILVTAHWGGVEYIPWALALRQYPLSVILEYQSEQLREFLREKNRSFPEVELVNQNEVSSVWKHALESLKKNRVVMTQCDEVDAWRRRPSRTIQLFNRTLYHDTTLELMVRHSGAMVVTAYMERTARHSYRLRVEPIPASSPAAAGIAVLQRFEYYVSRFPEQWYQWKKWQDMLVPADLQVVPLVMEKPYRAIVFDLDNTLYPATGLRRRLVLREVLRGRLFLRHLRMLSLTRKQLAGVPFKNEAALMEEMGRASGGEPFLRWYNTRFYRLMMKTLTRSFDAPHFVLRILRELREHGIPLYCYSDYRAIDERLAAIGLAPDLFIGRYSSEEYGELKPSSRVLVRVMQETGAQPHEVLMVGDREDTDGRSADIAGSDFHRIFAATPQQFEESWSNLVRRLRIRKG